MTVEFDSIVIERFSNEAWVDLWPDVMQNPRPKGGRGIGGHGPIDRVEDPGKFTFSLKNGTDNSQSELGYYSIGAGRVIGGQKIRVGFTYSGRTVYKWAGYVEPNGVKITQHPKGPRRVDVTCQNWFALVNTFDLDFLAYTTNKRIEEAVEIIIQSLPDEFQPTFRNYATGTYTFPDVFDLMNGDTKVVSEFQKLAMSEGGLIYSRANDSDGNTLVVESIATRNDASLSAAAKLDSDTTDLLLLVNGSDQLLLVNGSDKLLLIETQTFEFTDDHILDNGKFKSSRGVHYYSHIKASVTGRRVDSAATTVLWTMESPLLVAAGTTVSGIRGRYRDPSGGASYVNGIEIVRPAQTTDFRAFANQDGTGTEYTTSCVVNPTEPIGTAEIELSIQNTGTNDFYVGGRDGSAKFQVRGKGVYTYDTTEIYRGSTVENSLGRSTLSVEFPYHSDPIEIQRLINLDSYGESLASFEQTTTIEAFPMSANRDSTSMAAFMGLDVGSYASWVCELIGVNADLFIQSYTFEIVDGKHAEWAPMLGFNYFNQ